MNESRATRYQRLRRRARAAGLVSAGVVLAVIAFTPAAHGLATAARTVAGGGARMANGLLEVAVFVVLLAVIWELASLPAMLFLAFRVDRVYARPAGTVEEALGAQASATLLALPAALGVGGVVWGTTAAAGPAWWMAASIVLAVAHVAALRGAPSLFAWFGDVRPLARRRIRDRLADLARRSRVVVAGIDEWAVADGAPTTALVTGIGRGRRVLVSSEIVRHWTDDEIAVVVAHELAHHVYRDLWLTLALDTAVWSASLWAAAAAVARFGPSLGLAGARDLAALPLMALAAGAVWFLATPLRHAQSRWQERRADVFALTTTGHAEAFGAAIRRLGARHLAEERPSRLTRWLYSSHPSVSERLALAESYSRGRAPSS